jgi:hypothetical protein
VKLKEDIIIKCDFTNRKQVFGCTRNMENIFKMQMTTRGSTILNDQCADVHTVAVCSVHTVTSLVPVMDSELVQRPGM